MYLIKRFYWGIYSASLLLSRSGSDNKTNPSASDLLRFHWRDHRPVHISLLLGDWVCARTSGDWSPTCKQRKPFILLHHVACLHRPILKSKVKTEYDSQVYPQSRFLSCHPTFSPSTVYSLHCDLFLYIFCHPSIFSFYFFLVQSAKAPHILRERGYLASHCFFVFFICSCCVCSSHVCIQWLSLIFWYTCPVIHLSPDKHVLHA